MVKDSLNSQADRIKQKRILAILALPLVECAGASIRAIHISFA